MGICKEIVIVLSIQVVQDRISWHEKLGIYVLQCERRGNGHGSRCRTSVMTRFYIDLVVRLARCPGERMIIWTYAAIEFRIVNKRRHARTKSRASVPAARATSLAKHSSPRPQTAHHEKKTHIKTIAIYGIFKTRKMGKPKCTGNNSRFVTQPAIMFFSYYHS